jgi:HEAT repeat protein
MTPEQPKQLALDFSKRQEPDGLAGSKAALDARLLEAYLRDLSDPSWRVRKKAARGLGTLGPKATQAVPQLKALLNDQDVRVREAARQALEAIGSSR